MTPVPKQAKKPLGQDNARWGSRQQRAGKATSGATPRCTSNPRCCQRTWAAFQAKPVRQPFGLPARCLLQTEGDHFCSHLPCVARARFEPSTGRKGQGRSPGAPSSCIEAFDYASRIQAAVLDWEAPPWLQSTIADWHTDTFFRVRHTKRTYRLVSRVRPGDPLADLIFNACMTGFN